MKKLTFVLPIAALVLASCSNEIVEQTSVQSLTDANDALVIRPIVQGTTRGTVTTDGNLTSFHCTATPTEGNFCTDAEGKDPVEGSIDGAVTKNGSKWTFGSTYYWQSKSNKAKFTAYAPTGITPSSYSVEGTVANQKDVIVAYNEGTASEFTAGVPLNFQHVLSQIVVQAKNKDAATFKIEVAGVKLYNVKNQGALTLPSVKTTSPFDWSTYTTIWTNVTGAATYTTGQTSASATSSSTLTTVPANIASAEGPMLLMPQQLTAATAEGLKDESLSGSKNLSGTYLAVLIRATDISKKVAELNSDGQYVLSTDNSTLDFDSDSNEDTINDTYTEATVSTINTAVANASASATTIEVIIGEESKTIKLVNEVKFPREGYGNNSEKFAYVCVPIDTQWLPGYKYTYTLNFSKDGIGKIDPNFPTDAPQNVNYPGGTGGLKPGDDVIDNPIELFFTVAVDNWIDATSQDYDM